MRTTLYAFFVCIILSSCTSLQISKDFNIVGKWKAEDESGFGYFTFDNGGFAIIETEDRILGGKKFEQNGMEFSLRYTIDNRTKPINMDMTFTNLKSGKQLIWPCIIRVIGENEIMLARGENGQRPKDFLGSDYQVLKRVK